MRVLHVFTNVTIESVNSRRRSLREIARCAYCGKPVIGDYTTALGKAWHPSHFICAQCRQPFDGGSFMNAMVRRTANGTSMSCSVGAAPLVSCLARTDTSRRMTRSTAKPTTGRSSASVARSAVKFSRARIRSTPGATPIAPNTRPAWQSATVVIGSFVSV
ncbi:MAG: hypothetical protein IPO15_21780 [Anaerolineae bacterium]|nr:hypothetical protein [Anaerolineae bacterium]